MFYAQFTVFFSSYTEAQDLNGHSAVSWGFLDSSFQGSGSHRALHSPLSTVLAVCAVEYFSKTFYYIYLFTEERGIMAYV